MRIFVCAGEPSGDVHGANLVRALRQLHPGIECVGFGGPRMEEAGSRLLYPLCRLAVMWFLRVLLNARLFLRLLRQADRFFQDERPDAVVLIDYPGFNWHLARLAKRQGIPVFYFVPPQLWAWAGWRIRKMRRTVDHVLCSLPFEETWYRARGVTAQYIGHPYFDELPRQQPEAAFVAAQQARPGPIVGLLPGSRDQEITRNLSTLLEAARRIHTAHPETRFLVACLTSEQQQRVAREFEGQGLPVEVHSGRTTEIIQASQVCVAVSGSVGLELLYHGKPAVVLYRIRWLDLKVGRWFMTCRFISLVNLLADKELFPEYLTDHCEAPAVAEHVLRWLTDRRAHEQVCAELAELRRRVAIPGACARAARHILAVLADRKREQAA